MTASWLVTITANEARKAHRSRRSPAPLVDVTAETGDRDAGLDLRHAIAQLPTRQALAVQLYYYADLSLSQTAAAMGCAEGTVKSTLAAARVTLRAALDEV